MNKKMREILDKMDAARAAATKLFDEGKTADARAKLDEAKNLQADYEVAKELDDIEHQRAAEGAANGKKGDTGKASGFVAMAKMLRKEKLVDAEAAMITSTDDTTNTENYLVPEDVDYEIRELRKSYPSAKDDVTVIPTGTMSGSFNFETNDDGELSDLTDGEDISEATKPVFVKKTWQVALKAALIFVSTILQGVEKAGLMVYLNRWFVRKAVRTENKKIFATLRTDKTPIYIKGWQQLKRSINLDLDEAALSDGVIITNKTGWDILDSAVDGMGRPILQSDPVDRTRKTFQGLQVRAYPNKQLPNVSGRAPFFYGSIKAACYFIDLMGYQFAVSEHFKFNKAVTTLRVIEGFDCIQGDTGAYCYGLMVPDMGNGVLAMLDVLSVAGDTVGKTVLSAAPACPAGYTAKYKIGDGLTVPEYDTVIASGYTAIGATEIAATAGHIAVVVYLDADNKVKAAGSATVVVKAE
ncbi:MAG TPA: phage major capsid protein [Clostridia bacterium]|nr:phage major capsid protein [Clostridia bacterium]